MLSLSPWSVFVAGALVNDRFSQIVCVVRFGLWRYFWRRPYRCVLLTLVYVVWYLRRVQKPRVVLCGDGSEPSSWIRDVVDRCPSLQAKYWPTIWCPTSELQLVNAFFREMWSVSFLCWGYRRQFIELDDGQLSPIDWVEPRHLREGPVVVLLHGEFTFGSKSSQMSVMARTCKAKGLPVAILNRRGYGNVPLSKAKISALGDRGDLEIALRAVHEKYPHRPLALFGFSVGAMMVTDFCALRAEWGWPPKEGTPSILCAVALDGLPAASETTTSGVSLLWGYLLAFVVSVTYTWPYQSLLAKADKDGWEKIRVQNLWRAKNPVWEAVVCIQRFSCGSGIPLGNNHIPDLRRITVPIMLINSWDDHFFLHENQALFDEVTESSPNVVRVKFCCGGHGMKYGLTGFRPGVSVNIAVEFIDAAWATRPLRHD